MPVVKSNKVRPQDVWTLVPAAWVKIRLVRRPMPLDRCWMDEDVFAMVDIFITATREEWSVSPLFSL